MEKVITEKGFNGALKAIRASGDRLAATIHAAGLFALAQVNEHGNTGFGERLMDALGRKHDAKRVEKWLCHFGKFGMKSGKLVYRNRKDINAENMDATMQKAEATPYWELTQQEHHKFSVDYLTMLNVFESKHNRAVALRESGEEAIENNVAILDDIAALIQKYKTPVAIPAPAAA